MNTKRLLALTVITALSLMAIVRTATTADAPKETKAPAAPEFKLPPGWTEADLQACVLAATPGKMHERLAKGIGEWTGKNTMWMYPGADPMKSECTSSAKSIMDGRFVQVDMSGEMPGGLGPFRGLGIYGYDNVSKKFNCTMIDNQGTGMMTGTGDLSADGKTITWNCTFNCPLNGKPAAVRQIETLNGPDSMSLEMFGPDPKSGKEFKMMTIEFTRKK